MCLIDNTFRMHSQRLAVLIIYLLGIVGISTNAYLAYQQKADLAVNTIANQLNGLIGYYDEYYQQQIATFLPVEDCAQFANRNKHLLFTNRALRSLSVTDSGTIICSSVDLDTQHKLTVWRPASKKLGVFYGANSPFINLKANDDLGVLLIRAAFTPNYSVDFALHTEYLFDLLNAYQDTPIIIDTVNASFSTGGKITPHEKKVLKDQRLISVESARSFSAFWRYLITNSLTLIIFWSLFIIVVRRFIPQLSVFLRSKYWRTRWALAQSQFYPYLQPVFNIDGTLIGAEVLARRVHPRKGLIHPNDFIEVSERNGLIKPITHQLIEKCLIPLQDINFTKWDSFKIGFNACAIQFEDDGLLNDIEMLQRGLNNKPIEVVIEITERQIFSDNEIYKATIDKLKQQGVKIALDDFGTGYCSLKLMLDIDVDIIKIDRSYVNTIDNGPNTSLLENIIHLAQITDSMIVAEGIETQSQLDYLKHYNIKHYQGYLLGKPMPLKEFIDTYLS